MILRYAYELRDRLCARRIVVDAFWASLGVIGTACISLLQVRVITTYAAASEYGKATLILGAVGLANGAMLGPLAQAHLRLLFEYKTRGMEGPFERAFGRLQVKVVAACIGVYTAAAAALAIQGDSFYLTSWPFACLMLIMQPQLAKELNRKESIRAQRSINVASLLNQLTVLIVLLFMLILRVAEGDVAVLVAQLSGPAAAMVWLRRDTKTNFRPDPTSDGHSMDREVLNAAVSCGWSLPLTWVTYWIMSNSDRYFLESYLSPAAVGAYSLNSGLWSKPFVLLNGTLETLTRPLIYGAAAGAGGPSVWTVLRGRLCVTAIASALAIVLVACAWRIIDLALLAPSYSGTRALALVLAAAYALHAIAQCFTPVLMGRHRAHGSLVAAMAGAATSIACNYTCIPVWGMFGAAWAAAMGYAVFALAMACSALWIKRGETARTRSW